jgi:hypothetical protein
VEQFILTVFVGVLVGTVTRLFLLRVDYRQYPGYPHGYVTHISLGFIAAAIGAVAIPALVAREYTAVTFLALAAQQFREVREIERKTLARYEEEELVPRGGDYIEGIAQVFEARNYLVMVAALIVSFITFYVDWFYAVLLGTLLIYLFTNYLMHGETIGDVAEVLPATVSFQGAILKVNDIVMMNVGLQAVRDKMLKEGLGVVIKPKDDNVRALLHNVGQRQAILYTVALLLGTKKDISEQDFTPLARKNVDTGVIGLFIVPNEPDLPALIEAVRRTPVLEGARRRPLATQAGRKAAD